MELEVRYFASLTDRAGCSAEAIEVDPTLTVAELWKLLVERHPSLNEVGFRPLAAADRSYVKWDSVIGSVREVAFLPPVSGG